MKKFKVIDVHAHLGKSLGLVESETGRTMETTAEDLIGLMDKNEIDKAVISPIPGYARPNGIKDTMAQNDAIAKATERYPDRFPCGLGVVEPYHAERSLQEVERIAQDLRLRGLMFHTRWQGVDLDHPIIFRIFEKARDVGMKFALVHTDGLLEEPWRLARLAEAFPTITFINGHPGIDIADLAHNIYLCKKHENILLDTCIWHVHNLPFRNAVQAIGAKRILFGDDAPYYETSFDLLHAKLAEISDEDKELILGQNASRLFNISL
jgi:predicted TIM-barrel fold metal-dependent hydrolase